MSYITGFTGNVDFASSGNVQLGSDGNVHITGGTSGQVLTTDGSGGLSFTTVTGGNATPAGSNNYVQFNNNGVFGAEANLQISKANGNFELFIGELTINGGNGAGTDTSISSDSLGNLTIGPVDGNLTLSATGLVLPTVANVKMAGGTNGQVLTTDGSGGLSFTTVTGGNATPAGANTQIQYNDAGAFGATANLAFTDTVGGGFVNIGNNLSLLGNGTVTSPTGNLYLQPAANLIVTAGSTNLTFDTTGNLTAPGNVNVSANTSALSGLFRNGESAPAGLGSYQLAFGYQNSSDYSQFIHTTHNAGSAVNNTIDFYTSDGNVTGTLANAVFGLSVTNGGIVTANVSANGNVGFTGANVSLGAVANVHINGGTNGQVLSTDGNGNLSFTTVTGGNATPAGANSQLQFNSNGAFGASGNLVFTDTASGGNPGANLTVQNLSLRGGTNDTGMWSTRPINVQGTAAGVDINIGAGDSNNNPTVPAGSVEVYGGTANGATVYAGSVSLYGGTATGPTATAGGIYLQAGDSEGGTQGSIELVSGANTAGAYGNISLTGNVQLGNVANVHITGGTNGQVLTTDGTGVLSFANVTAAPAGANTQIQFNNAGALGASSNLTYNTSTDTLYTYGLIVDDNGIYGTNSVNLFINGGANADIVMTAGDGASPGSISIDAGANGSTAFGNIDIGTTNRSNIINIGHLQNGPYAATTTNFIGNVQLGAVANVHITGGTNGQVLTTDGSGNLSFTTVGGANTGNITFTNSMIDSTESNAYINMNANLGVTSGALALGTSDDNSVAIFANSAGPSAKQWTFDSSGNLTLPTNTFSVNYANGDPVSLAGTVQTSIANGNSNVTVTANSNITMTSGGSANLTFDTTGNLTVPGTVLANTVGNAATFLYGDGSNITSITVNSVTDGTSGVTIPATDGNVVVSVAGATITEFSASSITMSANITANTGLNPFAINSVNGNSQITVDDTGVAILEGLTLPANLYQLGGTPLAATDTTIAFKIPITINGVTYYLSLTAAQ